MCFWGAAGIVESCRVDNRCGVDVVCWVDAWDDLGHIAHVG